MSTYLDSLDAARGVFVGGTFRPGGAGVFDVENPATARSSPQVADGDAADATAAVEAANAALRELGGDPGPRALRDAAPRVRPDDARPATSWPT